MALAQRLQCPDEVSQVSQRGEFVQRQQNRMRSVQRPVRHTVRHWAVVIRSWDVGLYYRGLPEAEGLQIKEFLAESLREAGRRTPEIADFARNGAIKAVYCPIYEKSAGRRHDGMNRMKKTTRIPQYMAYPKFLLDMELSDTAKLVYVMLLDRSGLSRKNPGWTDEYGNVFVIYTIESLAQELHRCPMTVKKALRDLEQTELIRRIHRGLGRPNRIYVNFPPEGQDTVRQEDRKESCNRTEKNYTDLVLYDDTEPGKRYCR